MKGLWATWLRATTGETSSRQIARRVGRSHTTVLRWEREGVPPEAVIEIALLFGLDIFDALVAVGLMEDSDIDRMNLDETLQRLPTVRLTKELHRRAVAAAEELVSS